MPDITAFRGIRYDLGHVGSLADVTAPPYDVIDAELQDKLYKRHPANVVRLILNRDEPGDDDTNDRYTRAVRFLRNWLREGVLFTEGNPAVYVYHQTFIVDGESLTRRGFISRMRLEPFGEGDVHPHEETHAGAKADRLKLWKACKANLSSIFGMYADDENTAQSVLETAIMGQTPIEITDEEGTLHRVWPVTDVSVLSNLSGAMGGRAIYIADGHHRYETACAYRDEIAAKEGAAFSSEHPANFVLMTCVSMSDPGMVVLPTHRLFRNMPPRTSAQLIEALGPYFECEVLPDATVNDAAEVWSQVEDLGSQSRLAFYTATDGKWLLADLTEAGEAKLKEIAPEKSDAWRSLGVSILHRLVIDTLLNEGNDAAKNAAIKATPKYTRTIEDLQDGLTNGDDAGRDATGQEGSGGRFELAALVMPAELKHIQRVCAQGERMPAKSTFFYPKLLSGLVINPLE